MEILVIGGTRFIGRHFVSAALANGHRVTIFHRGRTGADLFPEAEHLIGDRNGDLDRLARGNWDATVDLCAFVPRHVRELHAQLGSRAGRYLLVSSVSVYAGKQRYGFTEDAPLVPVDGVVGEEITNETYGPLKVLCEQAARETFGDCLIVRPTYVVGPLDYSGRFTYWVKRLAAGGEMLAPGPATDYFQWIDGRDLANWMLSSVEGQQSGAFHAAAPFPPVRFGDALAQIAAAVGGPELRLSWVDRDFLLAREVADDLPMWPGADPDTSLATADSARAFGTGLKPRSLAETATELLAAETTDPTPPVGLDRTRERELLDEWHSADGQAGS
jgi:2'-hydroxyisoflavone reductase